MNKIVDYAIMKHLDVLRIAEDGCCYRGCISVQLTGVVAPSGWICVSRTDKHPTHDESLPPRNALPYTPSYPDDDSSIGAYLLFQYG